VKNILTMIVLVLFFPLGLFAGSIRLYNDSSYKLRAVIQGADGSQLGEVLINPTQSYTWADTYGQVGNIGQPFVEEAPNSPRTPYTVLWYCLDGNSYSICSIVETGATITAQSCTGARICKPQPKEQQGSSQGAQPQTP
jgi:hypothetical protein